MDYRRACDKDSETGFQLIRGRVWINTNSKKAESRQDNDADGLLEQYWDGIQKTIYHTLPLVSSQRDTQLSRQEYIGDTVNFPTMHKSFKIIPMFSGLLYCAHCGEKLYYSTMNNYKREKAYFFCSSHHKNSDVCSAHYVREKIVAKAVLESMQRIF